MWHGITYANETLRVPLPTRKDPSEVLVFYKRRECAFILAVGGGGVGVRGLTRKREVTPPSSQLGQHSCAVYSTTVTSSWLLQSSAPTN